jgi:hypothetical protein
MPKEKRQEAPTIAPKFNVEAYARESERRLAQASDVASRAPRSGEVVIPRAGRTGVKAEAPVGPSSVPRLVARASVTELLTFPTEAFLLGFIDGARSVEELAHASNLPIDLVTVTVADLARSGVVALV